MGVIVNSPDIDSDDDITSWAAVTRASGFDAFAATPSSANLRALVTDESGSGALLFANGALGTPSSGVLTNATGLPISTGVAGLGTGVATALAVNVGSAGAPVVNGGALGTPASGTMGNTDALTDGEFSANGLMVRTGVGAYTSRSLAGSGGLTVDDPTGAAANPTVKPSKASWRKRMGWATGSFEMDILDMSGPDYAVDINSALTDMANGEELTLRSSTGSTIAVDSTILVGDRRSLLAHSPKVLTLLREGDYGPTLEWGASGATATGGRIKGIKFRHLHADISNANLDSATLDNQVTVADMDPHVRIYSGQNIEIEDCEFSYLPIGLEIAGGAYVTARNLIFQESLWTPWNTGIQEGLAACRVRNGYSGGDIPSFIMFENCKFQGRSTGTRNRDFSEYGLAAGNHSTNGHLCGALRGLWVQACEDLTVQGGYFGGFGDAFDFEATQFYDPATGATLGTAVILSAFLRPTYMDGQARSHLRIHGKIASNRIYYETSATGGNCTPYGVLAEPMADGNPSVIGLTVSGSHIDFAATPLMLTGARNVRVQSIIKDWNNVTDAAAEGLTKKNWRSGILLRGTDYEIDGMETSAALAIGSTTTRVANGAFDFRIHATSYSKGAVAAGTALNAEVVPEDKFGAQALDIDAAGTITIISAPNNTTGYGTAAAAAADLPEPKWGVRVRMGYVTASKSDGAFTFGTTALDAANTTVAYTSATAGITNGSTRIAVTGSQFDMGTNGLYDIETEGVDITNDAIRFTGNAGSGTYGRPLLNGDITYETQANFAFHAHKSGTNQTGVANNTFTLVTWSTQTASRGGGIDTGTGQATPPPGMFHLSATIWMPTNIAGSNNVLATIYKNGSRYKDGPIIFTDTSNVGLTVDMVDYCDGDDYYEVRVFVGTSSGGADTATISGDSFSTHISGILH